MDTTRLIINARSALLCITAIFCLTVFGGCARFHNKRSWCPPNLATPLSEDELSELMETQPVAHRSPSIGARFEPPLNFLRAAELHYADARELEADESPACIESYFATVQFSWPIVENYLRGGIKSPSSERAWQLYHSSVAQLIEFGQKSGRFDPQRGLAIETPLGVIPVDVQRPGSVWPREEYGHVLLVGDYATPQIAAAVRRSGVGVPLVIQRSDQTQLRWVRPQQRFVATALMRPTPSPSGVRWTLELHDARQSRGLAGSVVPLAYDLTASMAYRFNTGRRPYLTNFLQPGASSARVGLYMVEPHQRGKIPVVFVHGLLSDPLTWADLANAMQTDPVILQRYQFWAFEYATGEAFFGSAAELRAELLAIRRDLDPYHTDVALDNMVVIGHSMGGLVAKLQITNSSDTIWRSFCNRPIDSMEMDPILRQNLLRTAFFTPVPFVTRVIFIGTPHRGSSWANRCIGKIGSTLVEEPAAETERIEALVAMYPDAFHEDLRRGPPRSIDVLKPQNPLLIALNELQISPRVTMHSIVGTGYLMRDAGPSDTVVPVSSAQLPGVASELMVDAKHEELHRQPVSMAEVMRILNEHATMVGQSESR